LGTSTTQKKDYLGLLFNVPTGADYTKHPTTLYDLFGKDGTYPRELTLGRKFQLARDIAATLGTFHRIRWYHKNLSCHNIFAFRLEPPQNQYKFYIGGFDFARPDGPKELSLNPADGSPDWLLHVHPELQVGAGKKRPRFRRRHDLYSLGVLLFQIGIWDPLDRYTKTSKGKIMSASEFHSRLLQWAPTLIPKRMGEIYSEVTMWCLQGGDDTPDRLENEIFELMLGPSPSEDARTSAPPEVVEDAGDIPLQTFYWKVIRRLSECHCQSNQ